MIQFALQIELAGGGLVHTFGTGEKAYDDAEELQATWRRQPPDTRLTFRTSTGSRDVVVGDIREVRLVTGGAPR